MSILWIHFKCSPSCKGISPVASFPCSATRNKIMINLNVLVHIPQDRSLPLLVARGTGSALRQTAPCYHLLRVTRGDSNPNLQVSITHARHVTTHPLLDPTVSSPFLQSLFLLIFPRSSLFAPSPLSERVGQAITGHPRSAAKRGLS